MSKMAAQKTTNVLTCGVCLERYRNPKLLPCFHTFCLRCVERLAGKKPSFPCPTCRTITLLPPGGASELQINFYLEKDLARVEAESGLECGICSEGKQAKHKCVQCQQVFCQRCCYTHDAIQACKGHTVLALTGEASDLNAVAVKDEKKCMKHKQQPLLLFCRQCQVSICMQCKLTSHDGHETEDVMDTGDRARAELKKELDCLAKQQQVLKAVLAKAEDFHQELGQEKDNVESEIRARTKELKRIAGEAQKESLDSLSSAAESAVQDLKRQEAPVKEKLEAVQAKIQHLSKVVDAAEDEEAVCILAKLRSEMEQQGAKGSGKPREEAVVIQKSSICHEFRSRAIRFSDALAFIGLAKGGAITETKAASLEVESLQETVLPERKLPDSNMQIARRHGLANDGAPSFVELVYSKNPNSTLAAMQLVSDDKIWLQFNPGGSVSLFGLFDGEGQRLEVMSQKYPTNLPLLTCEDDTVVSLYNGEWVRAGGEVGTLEAFSSRSGLFSKSSDPFLLTSSSLYKVSSLALPPQIDENASFTTDVASNVAMDMSADGRFFAFAHSNYAYVLDKVDESTALRRFSAYGIPSGNTVHDLCFAVVDGQEMLLLAVRDENTVLIVDHEDGCCLVRKLETDDCPLNTPWRLATNHRGRVWVGCNGGKVVIFDL